MYRAVGGGGRQRDPWREMAGVVARYWRRWGRPGQRGDSGREAGAVEIGSGRIWPVPCVAALGRNEHPAAVLDFWSWRR